MFASVSFLLNWINIAIYRWFAWVRHPKLEYSNVAIKRYIRISLKRNEAFFAPPPLSVSGCVCVCVRIWWEYPFFFQRKPILRKSESSEGNGRQCQLKNEIELSWVNKHLYSRICLNEQKRVCGVDDFGCWNVVISRRAYFLVVLSLLLPFSHSIPRDKGYFHLTVNIDKKQFNYTKQNRNLRLNIRMILHGKFTSKKNEVKKNTARFYSFEFNYSIDIVAKKTR